MAEGNIDLQLRKVYRVKMDKKAAAEGFVRIFDESGEDYLCPVAFFVPLTLPNRATRVFKQLV